MLSTLKKRADFLAVRGGVRSSHAGFLIEARPRDAAPAAGAATRAKARPEPVGARFGFTVTKKLGNAVTRNRIRRRLKAAVAATAAHGARDGFDYVIVARPAAFERPFADLVGDLDKAFQRLHMSSAASATRSRRKSGPQAAAQPHKKAPP